MRLWERWPAWLCLSLVLWMAAAESAHTHVRDAEATACSICLVAHSASPTLDTNDSGPVLATIGILSEEHVLLVTRPESSDAGIRGPPVL